MNEIADANVISEEVIVHPTVERTQRGWSGEARVIAVVDIEGKLYKVEKVIPLQFVRAD